MSASPETSQRSGIDRNALSVILLIDTSATVENELKKIKEAALAFAETLSVVVSGTPEAPTLYVDLDLDGLTGTFDIAPFVTTAGYDEVRAWLSMGWQGGVSHGTLSGQASGQDANCTGPDCTAWAEQVSVASWGFSPSTWYAAMMESRPNIVANHGIPAATTCSAPSGTWSA